MMVPITASFYTAWGHRQCQDTHRYIGKSTHSRERSCCSERIPLARVRAHYSGLLQGLTSLFAAESHKLTVSGSNEPSAGAETRRVSPCDTTMQATRRPMNDPTFDRRCPGCPGGVLPGPPQKWDTRLGRIRSSNPQIHSQGSEVSRLSWVIPKTIAYAGADAHIRPVNGCRNQAGQAGHPGKYRPVLGVGALRRDNRVSHFERSQAGHPRTAGTPTPSDRRCL